MNPFESIADIADRFIKAAKEAPVKTASAVELHPLAAALKSAAAQLRASEDTSDISLELLQKVAAAQIGTGAQNPSSGAAVGASLPKPSLPSLQTSGLGVTAGTGGAPATMKVACELRKIAENLRNQEVVRSTHLLKAATAIQHLLSTEDEITKIAGLPGWAKAYATLQGNIVKVHTWPTDKKLSAKLKMLQHGRANAPLHRKGSVHPEFAGKPGSGKPKDGWPAGSAMDRWRRDAGRR